MEATTERSDRALLTDGSTILLRRLTPGDHDQVIRLHAELPLDDHYLRFFTGSRGGDAAIADRILAADSVAVGAWRAERLLGIAHFRLEPAGTDPEIAVAVAHHDQGHGVASLLLEHLVAAAREHGVPRLRADVLAVNHRMMRVLRDSGLPLSSIPGGTVRHLVLSVPPPHGDPRTEHYVDAVLDRAATAATAGLRPLLEPSSVAVVGAGRRPDSVGRAVLRSLVTGGFPGPVYAVNPHTTELDGVRCVPTVDDLPAEVDLAVVCVPAAVVPSVADACGRRGIGALVVITSPDRGDPALTRGLAEATRRYGLRVVGPNCLGVVTPGPGTRLQATFGPPVPAGSVGMVVQSGGVAIALAAALDRLGLGISTGVSVGDAHDVNADDLLLRWAADRVTEAAVVHVESLRSPRHFARLTRRLARRIPVIAIRTGTSDAGARAAASHTAATATPRVVRDALLAQSGALAVDGAAEATGLLALLTGQPLPAGPRVAVVSNAGGLGVLAADACARAGLTVARLGEPTREALAALLPAAAAVAGPVDTTATVAAAVLTRVVQQVRADPAVDAVLVITVATALADPHAGIGPASGPSGPPVVAVRPDQAETVRREITAARAFPVFADPAAAAGALAAAVRRRRWLDRAVLQPAVPHGMDLDRARCIVTDALRAAPEGGWLEPRAATALMAAAGVPVVAQEVVPGSAGAVRAWRAFGGPVAVKADVRGLVHKGREGAVVTDVDSRHQVLETVRRFRARFGTRLRGVIVQPMVAAGTELLVGVSVDALCGPLLTVGLGGTDTDLVGDRAHCLVPVTAADLDEQLAALRAASALWTGPDGGHRRAVVRDVAARVARLADLVPAIAEAEINPLVLRDAAVDAVDVRVRLAPPPPDDPWLRTLPW